MSAADEHDSVNRIQRRNRPNICSSILINYSPLPEHAEYSANSVFVEMNQFGDLHVKSSVNYARRRAFFLFCAIDNEMNCHFGEHEPRRLHRLRFISLARRVTRSPTNRASRGYILAIFPRSPFRFPFASAIVYSVSIFHRSRTIAGAIGCGELSMSDSPLHSLNAALRRPRANNRNFFEQLRKFQRFENSIDAT